MVVDSAPTTLCSLYNTGEYARYMYLYILNIFTNILLHLYRQENFLSGGKYENTKQHFKSGKMFFIFLGNISSTRSFLTIWLIWIFFTRGHFLLHLVVISSVVMQTMKIWKVKDNGKRDKFYSDFFPRLAINIISNVKKYFGVDLLSSWEGILKQLMKRRRHMSNSAFGWQWLY